MKIAIVAPTEIPARRANTIQVMKMAQAFAERGQLVTLAAPSALPLRKGQAPPGASWEELAHHYGLSQPFEIEWMEARPSLRRYDYSWRAVRAARRSRADMLYTRLPQAAALASRLGLPTILEMHDLPQGRIGPRLFRLFLRGGGARRLVVITRALALDLGRQLGARLDEPFTVIAPDGVDLIRYTDLPHPAQARQGLKARAPGGPLDILDTDAFTIGYSGHLYPGRGTQLLVELAARLPQTNLLLAGGEPDQVEALRLEASRRGLRNLILTGFVPNAELALYQAACDVLLMPYEQKVAASSGGDISRYLSPMKLFEYLACERPIVSSNLPVLLEVLNSQNAVLLPDTEVDTWQAAIQALMDDAELRARLAGRARADAQQYTWQARAGKILQGLEP